MESAYHWKFDSICSFGFIFGGCLRVSSSDNGINARTWESQLPDMRLDSGTLQRFFEG